MCDTMKVTRDCSVLTTHSMRQLSQHIKRGGVCQTAIHARHSRQSCYRPVIALKREGKDIHQSSVCNKWLLLY